MSDAVIVGIISVIGSIVVQLIVSYSKNRETDAKMAAHEQEQKDRLESITDWMKTVDRKLDEHNGYAKKFADTSKDIALIQKDIEYLKRNTP